MNQLQWNEKMSVGIPTIDEEHSKLIHIINELFLQLEEVKVADVSAAIEKLEEYTRIHFAHEERLFETHKYEKADVHIGQYNFFIAKVSEFRSKWQERSDKVLTSDMIRFLFDWLVNHIMIADKAYSEKLLAGGAR